MNESRLRVRLLLEEYQWIVALTAAVLLLGGLWLTYGAYVAEAETVEKDQPVDSWSVTGSFTHVATVEEENELFPVGTTLEDEPVYYSRLSPTFNGEYVVSYDGIDGEAVTVDLEVALLYRAADDDTVYWAEMEPLEATTVEDVSAGEEVSATFSVDVVELDERIDEIEESLGASPGAPETVLRVAVTYEGTFGDEQDIVEDVQELTIDRSGDTYTLDEGGFQERIDVEESVVIEESPGTLEAVGGPLAALAGGGGLFGLGLARHRGLELSEAEREWLAYRGDLEEFEDLITRADLPDVVRDRSEASVATLGELAELAIDVGAAIVEDTARDRYVVEHQDLLYVYTPPADPETVGRQASTGADGGENGDEGGGEGEGWADKTGTGSASVSRTDGDESDLFTFEDDPNREDEGRIESEDA